MARYGLGKPFPWPMYTTMLAPCIAALTAAQVAFGLYTLTTFDVYCVAAA